ncbi:hypothetical protein [Myxococcus qinghaiensis]|uniref:hypothetical protein n=1 Tax=Myxococcus qinghaiensis TaxID=2906758 RepID=UPI0020A6E347|nr:hypothetical protein [Myxococcus qinghaiensis]MCP3169281.1 hypothetical protein [Myxococcus qinghaiensis]
MTSRAFMQHGAPPRTREHLSPARLYDVETTRGPRARPASERPTSIRDAIIRWLDQEL